MAEVIQGTNMGCGSIPVMGGDIRGADGEGRRQGAVILGAEVIRVANKRLGKRQTQARKVDYRVFAEARLSINIGIERTVIDGLGKYPDTPGVEPMTLHEIQPFVGIVLAGAPHQAR